MIEQEVIIQIHNLKIKVSTNYPKYYDYLHLHFNKVILPARTDNCEIEVKANWKMDFWGNSPPSLKESHFDDFESVGASTLLKDKKLVRLEKINKRRFRFEFTLDNKKLAVKAICHHKVFKNLFQNLLAKTDDTIFSDLTYYFIYYPAFWYLENFQGIHILHAGSVDINGITAVIFGLEGMGKTALTLGLLSYPYTTFISDNLLFYDAKNIYPCYQPLKIRPGQENVIKLKKIKEFKSKTYYELDKEPGRISYSPDIFLLPRFGKESYLKEIDREAFMQLVINSNFLVWELENYEHFTRLLSLIYQPFSLSELRLNSLKSLVNLSQCYILGIKRGEIIKDTVNRIKVLFKTK